MTIPVPERHPGLIPAEVGIGLRFQDHRAVAGQRPHVAWLEVHTENYMGGGEPARYLGEIRRDYPVSFHGVGLSLGSAEGLDLAHLERVRQTVDRFEPALVSEHLSWSVVNGHFLADLLPLPMTEEALDVVCRHVDQTQTFLGRRILVEFPPSGRRPVGMGGELRVARARDRGARRRPACSHRSRTLRPHRIRAPPFIEPPAYGVSHGQHPPCRPGAG